MGFLLHLKLRNCPHVLASLPEYVSPSLHICLCLCLVSITQSFYLINDWSKPLNIGNFMLYDVGLLMNMAISHVTLQNIK